MSADWQVGDLALCVDDQPQFGDFVPATGLTKGRVYVVRGVELGRPGADRSNLALHLVGLVPAFGRIGFLADRFRKIRPDAHEACEPDFIKLIKRVPSKVTA